VLFAWWWKWYMFMQAPLKFGTKCIVIHLAFLGVVVAKAISRVCKGSWSKTTHELPTLCGEGEHMVTVTWVVHLAIMWYESKCIPSITTFDNALANIGDKCYIIWEAQFLLPWELWWAINFHLLTCLHFVYIC